MSTASYDRKIHIPELERETAAEILDESGSHPGYALHTTMDRISLALEEDADVFDYEMAFWGQPGTDLIGFLKTLTPGVQSRVLYSGELERDSPVIQHIDENYSVSLR